MLEKIIKKVNKLLSENKEVKRLKGGYKIDEISIFRPTYTRPQINFSIEQFDWKGECVDLKAAELFDSVEKYYKNQMENSVKNYLES